MSQAKPMLLGQELDRAVAAGALKADAAQRDAAAALDRLLAALGTAAPATPASLFPFWRRAPKPTQGLYLWGDVGRGKSMLMDRFVALAQGIRPTRRIHFHAFMRDVHARMFAYRKLHQGEVIEKVIEEIAREAQVLCLDEFQVTDVADAMILSRLFTGLMDAGVVVLFTSNRRPRDLYEGGLQRDQFLKFARALEARIPLVSLNGPVDYRLAQLKALTQTYRYPRDGGADDFLLASWQAMTAGAPSEPLRVEVDGRSLRIDKQTKGVAWFTFPELCVRPLGASDYLTLAKLFHTLLLQGIPRLTPEDRNEAKRFVTLIDTLYDHRVKLIATAETPIEEIYPAGDGTFEFKRTVSRLHEMQAESYWAQAHIG